MSYATRYREQLYLEIKHFNSSVLLEYCLRIDSLQRTKNRT